MVMRLWVRAPALVCCMFEHDVLFSIAPFNESVKGALYGREVVGSSPSMSVLYL